MKCPNCKEILKNSLNSNNYKYSYCGNLQCNYYFKVYDYFSIQNLEVHIKTKEFFLIFYKKNYTLNVFLREGIRSNIVEKINTIENFVLDSDFKNLFNLIKKYEESLIFL
jgi:hypothetical protein